MIQRMPWLRLAATLLAVVLLVACQPQGDVQDAAQDAEPDAAKNAVENGPPGAATATDEATSADGAGTSGTPALQVTTIDGEQYDLAAHRGQWVVVNFWATWCAPCLKEMPELSALDAMRGHVEVIGLAYEEISVAAMQRFLEKHPVVYPIAIIDVFDPPADFATPRGLPMTYLIAPGGQVAKQFLGPVTAADIENAIAAAGGPQPGEAPDAPDTAAAA